MSDTYVLHVEPRNEQEQGKGASRRLRRENKVPAIIYGGDSDAATIKLMKNEVDRNLLDTEFYTAEITLDMDGKTETVRLQDIQRHPYKPIILHMDFVRC